MTRNFYYSCYSGAVRPAGCCVAAGRARSESAVPVLCSGFLCADGCADSNYCEVSFDFFLLLESLLTCFFVVVDYLMKRFGFSCCLSLKLGTNFKVFDLISFFIMDGYILEWCLFSVDLGRRYFHQV